MTIQQRARSALAAFLMVGLVTAGCGSSSPSSATSAAASTPVAASPVPPSTPASAPPLVSPPPASSPGAAASLATTGRIAVLDKGYAITLPAAWTRIEMGANGVKDLMDAGGSALSPELRQMLSGQVGQMAASGVSVFAFRQPDSSFAAGTTLNVLTLPAIGVPLDTFESLVVGQLKAVVGQDTQIATARVQGPAGEFLRLTYDLKVAEASIGTIQYLFIGPTQQYMISCGTPGPTSLIQAECESIATTLEVLN